MSGRRVLTASLLTLFVVGVLLLDVLARTVVGSLALVLLCASPALAELLVLLRRAGESILLRPGFFAGVGTVALRGALELLEVPATRDLRLALSLAPLVVVGGALALVDRRRFGPTVLAVTWVAGGLILLFDLRLLDRPVASVHPGGLAVPFGLALVVIVATSVKGGDSAAYAVGRSIGRTPMAPRISPRKTWEGAVGGFVVGTLVAPLLGMALALPPSFGPGKLLALGAAANVAGQIGDLAESRAKRRAGVKDSGAYLGELGGALDILDALLLASPVAYFVARVLGSG